MTNDANGTILTTGAAEAVVGNEKLVKLMPTLFIGIGGSGMEVLLRVRRRILNATWGHGIPQRISALTDFPIAQFMHFDLDLGAVKEEGRSQQLDPLAEAVRLRDEERLCETFEIANYCSSDNDLDRYPLIKEWSPLTPAKIRELNIDPSKGAGQIRAVSRLYFFDKYRKTCNKIRTSLLALKNGLSNRDLFERLGLEPGGEKMRIVVVCSIAGGTGSGSFLDMGLLAKSVASQDVGPSETHLIMLLPTGFAAANKQRTEANGYAALMELETCMRGGGFRHVESWDEHDPRKLPDLPYDEVYLIDSGNTAGQHTGNQTDVYEMVADALFEDFGSADFANKKRSIAVNQAQHKLTPFEPPVPRGRFGDMKLSFYKGYSAFGQAMIDTQMAVRRDLLAYRWMAEMLRAFFGLASSDARANRATDEHRDKFLSTHFQLTPRAFGDFPNFSSKDVDLRLTTGEFTDYTLTDKLLSDQHGSLVGGVQQKVDAALDVIQQQFGKDEWASQVRDAVKQLERTVLRDQDAAADVVEDRVKQRSKTIMQEVTHAVEATLYGYLDNREYGGLEYVISLVEQIKDQLENIQTGHIKACEQNAKRYAEVRDALRTYEYERLLDHLGQTRGFALFGSSKGQAERIMAQLKTEIGNYLKFHLRATAAEQAAKLLDDLSKWLGQREGVDACGNPVWGGFVGNLMEGRNSVEAMLKQIETMVSQLRDDTQRGHATYIFLNTPETPQALPSTEQLSAWAKEVFDGYGGSRTLFAMLRDDRERKKLFVGLRAQANKKLPQPAAKDAGDPLLSVLESLSPNGRQRKFSELLTRAMPWVHANLGGTFKVDGDQYKCFIGVAKSSDYKKYEEEIVSQLPPGAGITRNQVQLVDTGVMGRMVCYVELSGIPLTVLRGMETWRTSYRIETEKIPVHTHKDITRFVHPLEPSTADLERLAEDFQLYLKSVALGVLFRNPKRNISPPGQYKFAVALGDERNVGNERAFRMDGLPIAYRRQILEEVEDRLSGLNAHHMAALSALFRFYERRVYQPKLVADDKGVETPHQGFASAMAMQLSGEFSDKAQRKGVKKEEVDKLISAADKSIINWTVEVDGSDADAYPWEVQSPEEGNPPYLKRVVKEEFFSANWTIPSLHNVEPVSQQGQLGGPLGAPGFGPGITPPHPAIPGSNYQYMLTSNGQQYGPYSYQQIKEWLSIGQVTRQMLAWREGLAQWQALGELPEFRAGPTMAAPPPPPPPPPAL